MRFGLAAVAAAAALGATTAFTTSPLANNRAAAIRSSPIVASPLAPSSVVGPSPRPSTSLFADAQQSIDFAIAEAGANGVALFGKSACPFCFKAKKALLAVGIHPTVVNLDEVEGGPAMQSKLEDITGKGTVPNVWLDGKFIGGSEEVLAGLESGLFDDVVKGEVVELEEAKKVAIEQGPDTIKAGSKVPSGKIWTVFGDPEAVIDPAEYTKGKNILVVGLPGAFTPT